MQVLTLETGPAAGAAFVGTVLCQTVNRSSTSKSIVLRKGQIIRGEDIATLRSIERQDVRVIRLEDGDLHEDDAGRRLAAAIAGPGLTSRGPAQSRMSLVAATRGIAVINRAALTALNLIPDVSVFTVLPYQPVSNGQDVAGAKIIPVVTREDRVARAESLARAAWPIVEVKPYLPLAVGVVSKQRPDAKLRQRFEDVLRHKLAWFGASLRLLRYTEPDLASVTAGFQDVLAAGSDLILTAGSSSADPLDSLLVAVEVLGGTIEVRGAPAHPGSFFWLGYLGDRPVFGMPSCGAYSESTVVDLLLLRAMAGLRLTRVDLAELGAGGLFGHGVDARFPTYEIAEQAIAVAAASTSGDEVADAIA